MPTLKLNPEISVITDFTIDDIELIDYESHSAISMPMAV
jgi:thymidylate synthase